MLCMRQAYPSNVIANQQWRMLIYVKIVCNLWQTHSAVFPLNPVHSRRCWRQEATRCLSRFLRSLSSKSVSSKSTCAVPFPQVVLNNGFKKVFYEFVSYSVVSHCSLLYILSPTVIQGVVAVCLLCKSLKTCSLLSLIFYFLKMSHYIIAIPEDRKVFTGKKQKGVVFL